jgi:thioredoxin-like negative regulator of GroEL
MSHGRKTNRITTVDETRFPREVLHFSGSVLVVFSAPWSQPCRVLRTVLDEIAGLNLQRLKIVEVNADGNPDLGLWYGIQSVPTILCFVNGVPRIRMVGTATRKAILSRLRTVLPKTTPKPAQRARVPRPPVLISGPTSNNERRKP